ncbi:MAG: hypothetical protein PHI37_02960 [Candidatus Gracilibacteria bacterium]|nr:hypothetical protein [Candidatus Gracilibacteria bacterium]
MVPNIEFSDVKPPMPRESQEQRLEQSKLDTSNLTPEQQEVQNRIDELQKKLDAIGATEKITKKAVEILFKGLTSDPSIKNDPEALPTIQLLERYRKAFEQAQKDRKITESDLKSITENIAKMVDKVEFSAGINEKGTDLKYDTEKLKTISSKEFLSLSPAERLQYVTQYNVDSNSVSSGSIKDITFSFDQDGDGKINKELYMLTTAGQVLPKEIRQVTKDGQVYDRIGLTGEFYNGEKRLTIHDKTKIILGEPMKAEDLKAIESKNLEKYNEFITKNSEFKDEKYTQTLKEAFSKGIDKENELKYLLTGKGDYLKDSSSEELKKLLVVSMYLKNGGFLDDYADAGEIVSTLQDIIDAVQKYGKGLKYSVGEDGNIKFTLNDKGLPEGLEGVETSLEKFTQIALSQLGTSEKNGGADKYLSGYGNGLNSRNTPWCAAFVNWTLTQAGYKGTGGLSSKEFIGESGYGHVGIKLGDKLLGGNQGNKVSLMNINKPISGYAIPTSEGLKVVKPAGDKKDIPDGAILVFDRNVKKDTNLA